MLKVNHPETGTAMRYVSLLLFMIMALSDAYDGYVARKKKQVTRLGSFLDPMADKILMACACVLLSIDKTKIDGFQLPPTVAVLIIGKDFFLLLGFLILYFMTFQVKIFPAYIGKIATVLQLTMVAAILIAPEVSNVLPGWIWFLRILWWSAAGTAIIATLIYIRAGTRYIEQFENGK
jgi:CDP-diacylglycerol--glycerol-3-phosphate 3-phosphatidyltransferase